jgi:hypothetical protein
MHATISDDVIYPWEVHTSDNDGSSFSACLCGMQGVGPFFWRPLGSTQERFHWTADMLAKLLRDSLVRVQEKPHYTSEMASVTMASIIESLYEPDHGAVYSPHFPAQLLARCSLEGLKCCLLLRWCRYAEDDLC